jgi:hypothetical protein
MLTKLTKIIEQPSKYVPSAVKQVLSRDYWAGIKKRDIEDSALSMENIDPSNYRSRQEEEIRAFLRNDFNSTELYSFMEKMREGVSLFIEENLEDLDLEHFQKTFQTQVKFQYQQRDYRKRLIEAIQGNFGSDKFGLNDLLGVLYNQGKPTKENGPFVRDTLLLFAKQEILSKERIKNRIFYSLH